MGLITIGAQKRATHGLGLLRLRDNRDELGPRPRADRDVVAIDHQFSEANVGLGLSYVNGYAKKRFERLGHHLSFTDTPSRLDVIEPGVVCVGHIHHLENNREILLLALCVWG